MDWFPVNDLKTQFSASKWLHWSVTCHQTVPAAVPGRPTGPVSLLEFAVNERIFIHQKQQQYKRVMNRRGFSHPFKVYNCRSAFYLVSGTYGLTWDQRLDAVRDKKKSLEEKNTDQTTTRWRLPLSKVHDPSKQCSFFVAVVLNLNTGCPESHSPPTLVFLCGFFCYTFQWLLGNAVFIKKKSSWVNLWLYVPGFTWPWHNFNASKFITWSKFAVANLQHVCFFCHSYDARVCRRWTQERDQLQLVNVSVNVATGAWMDSGNSNNGSFHHTCCSTWDGAWARTQPLCSWSSWTVQCTEGSSSKTLTCTEIWQWKSCSGNFHNLTTVTSPKGWRWASWKKWHLGIPRVCSGSRLTLTRKLDLVKWDRLNLVQTTWARSAGSIVRRINLKEWHYWGGGISTPNIFSLFWTRSKKLTERPNLVVRNARADATPMANSCCCWERHILQQ